MRKGGMPEPIMVVGIVFTIAIIVAVIILVLTSLQAPIPGPEQILGV
jgi:hypothetical protein